MRAAPGPDPRLTAALHRFAHSGPVLVALDFDGVLAPLVDDPGASKMLPGSRGALRRLITVPRVSLALLSGRTLDDLRALAQAPPGTLLVASHGAEVEGVAQALDERTSQLLAQVQEELTTLAAEHPGTHVEAKPMGAVLHTRRAAGGVAARATSQALRGPAQHEGVTAMRGKDVVELSVVDSDKGQALAELRLQTAATAVLFAGDDVTDEHAFKRLWPTMGDIGIKVGEGETAAEHRVESCEAFSLVLNVLADLLQDRMPPPAGSRPG